MWEDRYAALLAEGERARLLAGVPEPLTYSYSTQALDIFPRYDVLHALQEAVEVFTPVDFGSLDKARELLAAAATSVEKARSPVLTGPLEQRAMNEERELFADYVRQVSDGQLASVEPLPFRRTLRSEESARLKAVLHQRWGIQGYWYPVDRPLDGEPPPPHALAFDAQPFFADDLQRRLRSALAGLSVSRLWELREPEASDHELDLELLEPVYTGAEGFWTDDSFDWLIYASHEQSVTIVGERLLPALQQEWSAWRTYLYER
jgi:hypothetical protein